MKIKLKKKVKQHDGTVDVGSRIILLKKTSTSDTRLPEDVDAEDMELQTAGEHEYCIYCLSGI